MMQYLLHILSLFLIFNQLILVFTNNETRLNSTEAVKVKSYKNKQKLLADLNWTTQQIVDILIEIQRYKLDNKTNAETDRPTKGRSLKLCEAYKNLEQELNEVKKNYESIYIEITNGTEYIIRQAIEICKVSASVYSMVPVKCDRDPTDHVTSKFKVYFDKVHTYSTNVQTIKNLLKEIGKKCIPTKSEIKNGNNRYFVSINILILSLLVHILLK